MTIHRDTPEWLFIVRHGPGTLRSPFLTRLYGSWVAEAAHETDGFENRLRQAALQVLEEEADVMHLHCALAALSVVGREEDIALIEAAVSGSPVNTPASAEDITAQNRLQEDGRTCIYYIRHGLRMGDETPFDRDMSCRQ